MSDPTIVRVEDLHPDADPMAAAEARELAADRITDTVPALYEDAVVTVPQVADWVHAVVQAAVDKSKTHLIALQTGPTLMMMGKVGTGKTHQAYGALRALAASGVRCKWEFNTAADIYARLRPRHGVDSETEFRTIRDTPLLVVDDLGANTKDTEFTEEVNYRLINWRNERRLATIVTTNLLPETIEKRLGGRVTSRLREFVSTRVVIDGEDRRGRAA